MASAQPQTFAALLRLHRRQAGLTQQELAEKAGLSFRTVSDLERRVKHAPRTDTLTRLADALALDARERVGFADAAQRRFSAAPEPAAPPAGHVASGPPLVGRVREMAILDRHLARNESPLLLLAGEPGIGKSRLLAEAAARAQASGWQVLAGGCTRRSGQEPYEPFVSTLVSAIAASPPARQRLTLVGCGWLVRLLPELAEAGTISAPTTTLRPEQERRLMFAALSRYLAHTTGPAGTLLVLDDLQWAGADALELLAALVREAAGAGMASVRVVGAYRETEVGPHDPLATHLADLARDGLVARWRLEPLVEIEAQYPGPAMVSAMCAWALLDLGEVAEAEALIGRVVEAPRTDLFLQNSALRIQTMVFTRQRRWHEAQDSVESSIAIARSLQYPFSEARGLYVCGLLYQAKGEPDLASEQFEQALAILRAMGERLYASRIERMLAEREARDEAV